MEDTAIAGWPDEVSSHSLPRAVHLNESLPRQHASLDNFNSAEKFLRYVLAEIQGVISPPCRIIVAAAPSGWRIKIVPSQILVRAEPKSFPLLTRRGAVHDINRRLYYRFAWLNYSSRGILQACTQAQRCPHYLRNYIHPSRNASSYKETSRPTITPGQAIALTLQELGLQALASVS